MRMLSIALSLSLMACTAGSDDRLATGSSTAVASSSFARMYVVNPDAGTISEARPGDAKPIEIDVGLEPTRIARTNTTLFVTLRGERTVAVLEERGEGAELVDRIEVGAEPYGIVASNDGSRIFVAVSQDDRVVEIDPVSRTVTRSWFVPNEPRYVALHPNSNDLFVGTGRGRGALYQLDVRPSSDGTSSGEMPTSVPLPTITRLNTDFQGVEITPRLTGDMAITSDGDELVLPITYVDNINPVGDASLNPDGRPVQPVSNGYGGGEPKELGPTINRFNPAVIVLPVSGGSPEPLEAEAIFLTGQAHSDTRVAQGIVGNIRSAPSSVTPSPDGSVYVVTFQGSAAVALVGALPAPERTRDVDVFDSPSFGTAPGELPFTLVAEGGFDERPQLFVDMAGHEPAGVVFLGNRSAWVHSPTTRVVGDLAYQQAVEDLRDEALSDEPSIRFNEVVDLSNEVAPQVLDDDVYAGRQLFFSSTNKGMAAEGAGVACASCHFDGRNDGLTWAFESGDLQTPSLAGKVSDTAPVTWTSDVPTVAHEARITTEARMGGAGLDTRQLNQIAAYIDWSRVADTPTSMHDSESLERGKALFEREDLACASCHTGDALTDNASHAMFGLDNVNTPTLRGIAASGPYLHDGRANTLRDVVLWSQNGEMGDTSMLSPTEIDDLTAYLTSL